MTKQSDEARANIMSVAEDFSPTQMREYLDNFLKTYADPFAVTTACKILMQANNLMTFWDLYTADMLTKVVRDEGVVFFPVDGVEVRLNSNHEGVNSFRSVSRREEYVNVPYYPFDLQVNLLTTLLKVTDSR